MGVVYRVTDLLFGRRVALKVVAPGLAADPTFRARFESECRHAASSTTPTSSPSSTPGEESGVLYVTMRYVEGTDFGVILLEQRGSAGAGPRLATTSPEGSTPRIGGGSFIATSSRGTCCVASGTREAQAS